jgi:hypothetical protein
MSIKYYANRVQETTSGTGASNLVLSGSPTGYRRFSTTIGPDKTITYYIYRSDNAFEWEIGTGYILSNGGIDQLVRQKVSSSSSAGSFVNFSAGTKYVETIISDDRVNTSFQNVEEKSSSFTAAYIPTTYIVNSSSGNVQVSLPTVINQEPIILGFLLTATSGNVYSQTDAIKLMPNGIETINGLSSKSLSIKSDYLQIASIPSKSGWIVLDPIQDSTNPYGSDGTIQFAQSQSFSGVSTLSWDSSSSSLLIGGSGLASADNIISTSTLTTIFNEQSRDKDFRIEGSGTTHMFFVDAGLNRIGINTSSVTDTLTVQTPPNLGIRLNASGLGPTITLVNTSPSGLSTNSRLGSIVFSGLNSSGSSIEYGRLYGKIISATSNAENSSIILEVLNNGTKKEVCSLTPSGVTLGFNNSNTNGILLGGASSNEGDNIVLGYYNNACGSNCVVIGNDSNVASGTFGGAIGRTIALSGSNVWVFGGSGVSLSGSNATYLALNNDNHIDIKGSGLIEYNTKTDGDTVLKIKNNRVLSSGVKESLSFEFQNVGGSKTGVLLTSDLISVTNGSENSSLTSKILVDGASTEILRLQKSKILIGSNTSSGNNLSIGSSNTIYSTGNIIYGNNILTSGTNNVIVGSNLQASGNNISIFGSSNTCLVSGNLGVVIFGNNNSANEDYAVSLGSNNSSSGLYSVACGYLNGAHGAYSVGIGSNNTVVSKASVAVGRSNSINSSDIDASIFAVGIGNNVNINGSGTVVGHYNQLYGSGGLVIGKGCVSSGLNNIVIGNTNSVSGNNNFIFGNNINWSGSNTTIFGGSSLNIVWSGSSYVNATVAGSHNTLTTSSGVYINSTSGVYVSGNVISLTNSTNNRINISSTGVELYGSGTLALRSGPSGSVTLSASGINYTNYPTATGVGTTLVIENNTIKAATSSERFKENIRPYDKGLNTLLQINPVYFNYKNSNVSRAGLIAESISELGLNEFVSKDSNGQIESLDYGSMIVILINSIKELKHQLDIINNK